MRFFQGETVFIQQFVNTGFAHTGDNGHLANIALGIVQKPDKATPIPPVRLTLTSSKGAFEGAFKLP